MTPYTNRLTPRAAPALALLLASALALPPAVEAQRAVRRDGGGSAAGSGGSSGGSGGSPGGSSRRNPGSSAPSGPSSGGSTAASGGSAAPRGSGGSTTASTASGSGASNGERSRRGDPDDVPTYSRPREGQPSTGTAVARRGAPPYGGGTDIIYVPRGGYYPWGYGGFGFGGYYGGYYDPWYLGYGGYGAYDPYYSGQYYGNDGDAALRLKVKPRDATVYADGYYVGRVDDFDGMFQRLHIEAGPHRIEIRADGYETLEFEVRLLPGRTLTYEAELRPRP